MLFVANLDPATYRANTDPMLSHINVGTGQDCTIGELAETMAWVTGFTGRIVYDSGKPDGTPRKLMDVSRLARMGWTATIGLEDGIRDTYAWFLEQYPLYRDLFIPGNDLLPRWIKSRSSKDLFSEGVETVRAIIVQGQ